jgi:small subunit ribosomal protein S8
MDPIANMFTIIRNGCAAKKETVSVPYSNIKVEILKVLQKEGYVKATAKRGRKSRKNLEVVLLYDEKGQPVLSRIRRISKPSRRVYLPLKRIFPVRHGYGTLIISTPKGVMSGKEAKKQKVGGEVIAEVW